jgi:hypothetical protein
MAAATHFFIATGVRLAIARADGVELAEMEEVALEPVGFGAVVEDVHPATVTVVTATTAAIQAGPNLT